MRKPVKSQDQRVATFMKNLTDTLLVMRAIKSKPVEEAFQAVPRHLFVDQYYPRKRVVRFDYRSPTRIHLERIYSDAPLVTHRHRGRPRSSTSQPNLVAHMLEELILEPGMKVLEIGAGTGWNAALIGHVVGDQGQVHSIDIQGEMTDSARNHIRRAGIRNVRIITTDGGYGYRNAAPYDRIITTACCPDISPHWIEQLADGGALLVTLRDMAGSGMCLLTRLWKRKDHANGTVVGVPGFMMLQGKYGAERTPPDCDERLEVISAGRRPRSRPAPWARLLLPPDAWRWRLADLIFFAYLEGNCVEQIGERYALYSDASDSVCVSDHERINLYGNDDAYQVLEEVTSRWIELGAPRRHDYRVEVWPLDRAKRKPKDGWLVRRQHSQLIFRLKKDR